MQNAEISMMSVASVVADIFILHLYYTFKLLNTLNSLSCIYSYVDECCKETSHARCTSLPCRTIADRRGERTPGVETDQNIKTIHTGPS